MKVFNLFFILFLINISLIYTEDTPAPSKYEIPISFCPDKNLPTLKVLLGEEITPSHLFLNLGQKILVK